MLFTLVKVYVAELPLVQNVFFHYCVLTLAAIHTVMFTSFLLEVKEQVISSFKPSRNNMPIYD